MKTSFILDFKLRFVYLRTIVNLKTNFVRSLYFISVMFICACNNVSNSISKDLGDSSTSYKETSSHPADFFVYYPKVQKVTQPDNMSCWAAALTMLYSHKLNQTNLKIIDVLTPSALSLLTYLMVEQVLILIRKNGCIKK